MHLRIVAMLALGATLLAGATALADEPLAGGQLFATSHGQPFCTSRGALAALLRAQIAHDPVIPDACRFVEDNTIVVVGEDLGRGRYMHMVRARANLLFGAIDGYTYSVGLYPYPIRLPPFRFANPFADY